MRPGGPGAGTGGGSGRRVARALALALLLALLGPERAGRAESWGGITPGETTRAQVQALFGPPSREQTVVEEGRTALEWTYMGERAPRGLTRMAVSFGLLRGGRFEPDVVRALALEPKPHVFSLRAITSGWGQPDAIGTEEATGRPSLQFKKEGLLVILDRTGSWAELLLLAPRPAAGGS
jgi:hypothetical protein